MSPGKALYMLAPQALEAQTKQNLEKTMQELVEDGTEITVTDENLPVTLKLIVRFES